MSAGSSDLGRTGKDCGETSDASQLGLFALSGKTLGRSCDGVCDNAKHCKQSRTMGRVGIRGAELTGSPPTFDCRQSKRSLSLINPSANPRIVVSAPVKAEVDATLLLSSSSSEAVAGS